MNKRPIIGITGNFGDKGCELAEGYYRSVLEAGGVPVVIPPFEDEAAADRLLMGIDGLLLSGGGDINPLLLGEEPSPALHSICPQRDGAELMLVEKAFRMQMPMFGICRGIQVLAAALGGKLHQDIAEGMPGVKLLKHSQQLAREYASHTVSIDKDSLLASIMNENSLAVNSFHHQAVAAPGSRLRVCAVAPDGVIEAVESTEYKSILGVQWHPECFILRGDRTMLPLFQWLVGEAQSYREARWLHQHTLTLDSHCDTPMKFDGHCPEDFSTWTKDYLVDLPKMKAGGLDASIMVAYLPQGERDEETVKSVTRRTDSILSQIEEMVAATHGEVLLTSNPEDLYANKRSGKKSLMVGIENGYAIGKDLSLLKHFKDRGIVYMTLCHNGDNDICDSARGNAEHGGLSDFGREVVREMNRLGIVVDMSHAAESSFWQALELSEKPIVCSHSSCRALCDHPRNLTDEQMAALAKAGGVMQVTFYEGFLRRDGQATIEDAIAHIKHAVRVMGIDHVGIGTDFDGDGGVPGVANASELPNITRRLIAEGFSHEDLKKLWGGNFLKCIVHNS